MKHYFPLAPDNPASIHTHKTDHHTVGIQLVNSLCVAPKEDKKKNGAQTVLRHVNLKPADGFLKVLGLWNVYVTAGAQPKSRPGLWSK